MNKIGFSAHYKPIKSFFPHYFIYINNRGEIIMNEQERLRRGYDFFSTLSPQLQNQLAMQNKLKAENKAPEPRPIIDKYHFTKWYD